MNKGRVDQVLNCTFRLFKNNFGMYLAYDDVWSLRSTTLFLSGYIHAGPAAVLTNFLMKLCWNMCFILNLEARGEDTCIIKSSKAFMSVRQNNASHWTDIALNFKEASHSFLGGFLRAIRQKSP